MELSYEATVDKLLVRRQDGILLLGNSTLFLWHVGLCTTWCNKSEQLCNLSQKHVSRWDLSWQRTMSQTASLSQDWNTEIQSMHPCFGIVLLISIFHPCAGCLSCTSITWNVKSFQACVINCHGVDKDRRLTFGIVHSEKLPQSISSLYASFSLSLLQSSESSRQSIVLACPFLDNFFDDLSDAILPSTLCITTIFCRPCIQPSFISSKYDVFCML